MALERAFSFRSVENRTTSPPNDVVTFALTAAKDSL
jgi:hypothetical protein